MVTLYFKEGTSDKVYQVSVDPTAGGYDVNFAYGRRGSTMNTGKKNTSPLPQGEAQKIADKLVKEKMAKGYTPGPDGAVYKKSSNEDRYTGIVPMLLNPISEDELEQYIRDDTWVLQQKYDGRRMMIRKQGDVVDAINRKGLTIGAPQAFLDEAKQISGDFVLDGEAVGEIYYAFDIVHHGLTLYNRLSKLKELVPTNPWPGSCILYAPWYTTFATKDHYVKRMRDEGREGVVFKDLGAFYSPGRPASGGPAVKCKFYATANVRVTGINVQRSVEIALLDGTPCGNVTVPVNRTIPHLNDIIEVRYLYAMPGSNALYQPVYSMLRDDIAVADGLAQLKYKREED